VAIALDGTLYAAWQDKTSPSGASNNYEVWLAQLTGSNWSLPVDISDHAGVDAVGVSVAASGDGQAQLAWAENSREIRYSYGRGWNWSVPLPIYTAAHAGAARGPRIVVDHGVLLGVVWDEGTFIRASAALAQPVTPDVLVSWTAPSAILSTAANVRDVTVTVDGRAGTLVGWVQTNAPGNTRIFESRRPTVFTNLGFLPLLLRQP
jgi:hypothetical protein